MFKAEPLKTNELKIMNTFEGKTHIFPMNCRHFHPLFAVTVFRRLTPELWRTSLWAWLKFGLLTGAWACIALPGLASELQATETVRRIVTQGSQVLSDQIVSLPDRLEPAWRDERVRIAYEWDLPAGRDTARGLWLFRAGGPYQIWINAELAQAWLPLGDLHKSEASHNGRSPALFIVPQQESRVRIEFKAMPFMPVGLVELCSGSLEALTVLHQSRYEETTRPVFLSNAIAAVLGVLTLLLWAVKRDMPILLFFALMCLSVALRGWLYTSSGLPLPAVWFEQANPLLVLCFTLSTHVFTLLLLDRYTSVHGRLLTAVGLGMGFLFGLSLLVPASTAGVRAVSLAMSMLGLILNIALMWVGRAGLSKLHAWVLTGGYVLLVAASLHDMGMVLGHIPPTHGTLIVWGFLALLLAFSYITAEFVLRNLSLAQNANEMLAQKVKETSLALEQSYQALARHQTLEARRQERSHIMRELHDSLGSQLITALRGVERGALSQQDLQLALEDSLTDLRQLLSTNQADGHLNLVLGNWRQHWEPRLLSAGVRIRWHLDDSIDDLVLPPEVLHHLLRILQESATNTLKHAKADTFSVSARCEGDSLVCDFCDNGVGWRSPKHELSDQEAASGGQGLLGMQKRAQQMGAALSFMGAPGGRGACVRLALQCASPSREASSAASARDDTPNLR
jgi:signal transduction histidine kinase